MKPWIKGNRLRYPQVWLLLAWLLSTACAPLASQHQSAPPTLPNNAPRANGVAASHRAAASDQTHAGSLLAALTAARYAIRPGPASTASLSSELWAQNPAHGLNSTFTTSGLRLRVRTPAAAAYHSTWRLMSLGYGSAQHPVPAGVLHNSGQTVELVRPVVTEWFRNGPAGLEHGFTLPRRPAETARRNTAAPLQLVLQVAGNLAPQATADGQRVDLRNRAGETVLTYAGLRVWDAAGQPMVANLTTLGNQILLQVADATARYPLTIDPTFSQQAYLKASNTGMDDGFGTTVAIDGDTVVIGASGEDSNATGANGDGSNNSTSNAGAAYVFTRSGTTWSQQAYLKASNTGVDDAFGVAVAIAGDTVVIGANQEDSNATGVNGIQNNNLTANSGAAYVFTRSGTTWSQQAYLKASNTGAGDFFGSAVAVAGDTVIVGANQEDSNATVINGDGSNNSASNAGAAYVFTRSGTTWSQQAYLKASNTGANDAFGSAVAIAADTIVVGAINEDSNATGVNGTQTNNSASNAGAAYVFTRSGTTWSQQAYLKASNTGANDAFGRAVAVTGDTIVVGAINEDGNATVVNGTSNESASNAGAAYSFTRSGTTWSQQAYLKASNTGANDAFGSAVAIAADTIVVGAINEDSNATGVNGTQTNNSASNAGAAYVFTRSGTTWSQQAYLKASNTGANDAFGSAAAIAADTIVVGAINEDGNATGVNGTSDESASNAGAAYGFTRSGTTWSQQAYLKASNTGANDTFGRVVAVAGNTIVVGTNLEDSNATGVNGDGNNDLASAAGAAYVFLITYPEIELSGNSVAIASGDTTPDAADHTDFGNVEASSGTVVRTFTVNNTGAGTLTISGVTISGANASDFTVTTSPASSVAGNSSTTFQVTFDPSAVGMRTATVTIANDDSDEASYTFALQGIGVQHLPLVTYLAQQGGASQSCSAGTPPYVKNCTVSFTLQNISGGALQISEYRLTTLSNHVFVLNGTPNPGQVGTVVAGAGSVANTATFQPQFSVGLLTSTTYALRFRVFGYASGVVAAGAEEAQAVDLGEFEATLVWDEASNSVRILLPIIQR